MATVINGSDNFNTNNVASQTELDAVIPSLGDGQTWQNVLASRNASTTYTNTTGRPIYVVISAGLGSYSYTQILVDGVTVERNQTRDSSTSTLGGSAAAIVPNGSTYFVYINVNGASNDIDFWMELR